MLFADILHVRKLFFAHPPPRFVLVAHAAFASHGLWSDVVQCVRGHSICGEASEASSGHCRITVLSQLEFAVTVVGSLSRTQTSPGGGRWMNQRLVEAGEQAVPVKTMVEDLADGVVICQLLECLTGEHIKGIDHNPRSTLAKGANLNILWKWMRGQDIELGGITPLSIQQGNNERSVLALMWRFIQKYDLVEGDGGLVNTLLEWVKPRTDPHKVVNNFTSHWQDGVAFLALVESIAPGSVDMAAVDPNQNKQNLQKAFDLIEEKLFVPQMLSVHDLDGRPDKSQIMTYVAAIKNAAGHYEEADKRSKEAKNEHKSRGDELMAQAIAKQNKAAQDGEDKVVWIVDEFKNDLPKTDGTNEQYEDLKAAAMAKMEPIYDDFDVAKDLFAQAKAEYDQVDDKECKELGQECDERGAETVEQKEELRKKLEDQLDKAIGEDQEERAYNYVVDFFNNTYEENQEELNDKLKGALKSIEDSTSPDERNKIVKDLDRIVDKLIEKMDKVGVAAQDALDNDLYDEKKVAKVEDIKQQCDEYGPKIRKYVQDQIDDALAKAGTHDQTPVDDLIKLYHEFSINLDEVGSRGMHKPEDDEGVPEEASAVRSRLDRSVGQLERNLREKVQTEVDNVFEEESLLGTKWTKDGDRYNWKYENSLGGEAPKDTDIATRTLELRHGHSNE